MKVSKKYIVIFTAATFFYWSSIFSHMSIISGYAEDLGAGAVYIGIIGGAYGLSQVILRIPLGLLSDKLRNRKAFITGATASTLIAGIIMFYSKTPKGLLIGRIICGVAGCAFVQLTILYSAYYDESHSAKAMSTIVAISNMSQMAGMLAGGLVGNLFGRRYVFALMAFLAGIGLIVSIFVQDTHSSVSFEFSGFMKVMKAKSFIVSAILAVACLVLAYGKSFTFVPLLANRIGASPFEQSLSAALFSLTSIVSALFCSRSGIDIKKIVIAGFILHAAGSFVLDLKHTFFMIGTSQVLSGLGNGMLFSMLMALSLSGVSENLKGASMGMFQAVYGLGMIAGPVVMGSVIEKTSLEIGFAMSGILSLVSAVFAYIFIYSGNISRKNKRVLGMANE